MDQVNGNRLMYKNIVIFILFVASNISLLQSDIIGGYKVSDIDLQKEYPTCFVDEIIDVGLPPSEEELLQLQSDIKKVISMLIEQGLDMQLPDF